MTHFLTLIFSLAILVGAVAFASQGANRVSFVELPPSPATASTAPYGSAMIPA